MLNGRCQDGVQQEAVAGIAVPMSGVKGEPFDKGASGETPGSGRTEPGWNELPKSMAELTLLWSLSLKGKKCSVGWGNGQLRSPGPWEPVLFPSPGRYQLHCCTMSTLPHHLLLDSPPCMSLRFIEPPASLFSNPSSSGEAGLTEDLYDCKSQLKKLLLRMPLRNCKIRLFTELVFGVEVGLGENGNIVEMISLESSFPLGLFFFSSRKGVDRPDVVLKYVNMCAYV